MSDKELNDYKVRVEGNETGEYKVSIDENNLYNISIEELAEDKGSLKKMIAIAIVFILIIAGLVCFYYKLDSLNEKLEVLQEKLENNAKERQGIIESTNSKLKELQKHTDDVDRRLVELQESNKVLEGKLDSTINTSKKVKSKESVKRDKNQDITKEEYYLIKKSKIPLSNQEIPKVPSADLEIPKIPSLN